MIKYRVGDKFYLKLGTDYIRIVGVFENESAVRYRCEWNDGSPARFEEREFDNYVAGDQLRLVRPAVDLLDEGMFVI